MDVKEVIQKIVEEKAEVGGIKQVYYIGCGGSFGAFYPAKTFVEKEAVTIKVGLYTSNEFVHSLPNAFGKNTVVIVASHKGNTPETIKAAEIAKKSGVTVIGLTWITDSELVQYCDYVLTYTFGDNKDIGGEKAIIGLLTAVEIVNQTEGYENYDKLMAGVGKIDLITKNACKHVEKRALNFAQEYKNDKVIYTMASGAGWGAAYIESICIFLEMQWINSACIHTGEFFHGPFEIIDKEIPFILQLSEGSTRALDERAVAFLDKYAKRVEILDAKDLGLSTIDVAVVDYFNHSLFNNVYAVYNKALADVRQHPLTTRRYMWKVEY